MERKLKPCPVCKTTEHPKAESKGYLCKPCASARASKWNKDNPQKQKDRYLKKEYGITHAEYQDMFNLFDGVCWVCSNPEEDVHHKTGAVKSLAVDHNHKTGKVRGLLCRRCNTSLGLLGDNTQLLKSMINYLEKYDG